MASFLPGGMPEAEGLRSGLGPSVRSERARDKRGDKEEGSSSGERRGRWPHSGSVGKEVRAVADREGVADPKLASREVGGGGRSPFPPQMRALLAACLQALSRVLATRRLTGTLVQTSYFSLVRGIFFSLYFFSNQRINLSAKVLALF